MTYDMRLVEKGLAMAESQGQRAEGLKMINQSGLVNAPYFNAGLKGIIALYAYLMPSSYFCKLCDEVCGMEMAQKNLYGIKYIKAKFDEAQNLGMRARDKMYIERLTYLEYSPN